MRMPSMSAAVLIVIVMGRDYLIGPVKSRVSTEAPSPPRPAFHRPATDRVSPIAHST